MNKQQIISDGEPMRYDHDFTFADAAAEANLKITAERWLPSEPIPSIPYDEMRRLCGLPDVSAYIARRDAALAWAQLRENFHVHALAFGQAFAAIGEAAQRALVPITAFATSLPPAIDPHNVMRKPGEVPKPKRIPPMWAVDPSHSPRTRNRATDIRTPFR